MGNNPVSGTDPDGGKVLDDYFFDKDMNLVGYVANDQPDRAFIMDGDGSFEFAGNMFTQIALPESFYDYGLNVIPGKGAEDWDYITSDYAKGNSLTRAAEIFDRDFNAAGNQETVSDVTIVLGRPSLRRPGGKTSTALGARCYDRKI
jgi:hypothetical protein